MVTVRSCDPARMTPEARVAELGALLARAWRRDVSNSQKRLDAHGDQERACARAAVDGAETPEPA